MKRTFLARRNGLLSSANLSWGSIMLAVAVLLLLVRLLLPNFFWYAFAPLFREGDALAEANQRFFSGFNNAAALTLQNEKLTQENAALVTQNEALLDETKSISALTSSQGITAGVVSRPPESPYDTLVIAAGSADGITLGMEAFGAGNVPLGTVTSILTHFSQVTLFSAPGVSVQGWVGPTHAPVIIKGSGGSTITTSISRSANIAVGDIVSVPGPGALPIGTVIRVDSDPSSPSVTLRIQPSLTLFSITWVVLRDTGAALQSALSASSTPTLP